MRRRIREIARFTKDPHVLARFYAEILGKSFSPSDWDAYNFEVDGVNLFIHPTSDQEQAPEWPEDVDHIASEVEDLDAECRRLATAGYVIKGPTQFPRGRSAYLYDPDGRMVELHQGGPASE